MSRKEGINSVNLKLSTKNGTQGKDREDQYCKEKL